MGVNTNQSDFKLEILRRNWLLKIIFELVLCDDSGGQKKFIS